MRPLSTKRTTSSLAFTWRSVAAREVRGGAHAMTRLSLVVGAAFDVVGLGVLFLQQTGEYRGDLPADLPSLGSRLGHTLDHDWFPWLVAASVFPVLGATGAVCLWRPLLWLYCAFLVACIGERVHDGPGSTPGQRS